MTDAQSTEPVILPWAEMQKKAERDGVDIMVYVNSMHAHVVRQRETIKRLDLQRLQAVHERDCAVEDVKRLSDAVAAARVYILDHGPDFSMAPVIDILDRALGFEQLPDDVGDDRG